MVQNLQFTFIVPFYDDADSLLKCLQSIISLKYDQGKYDVLIIDDGSPLFSKDIVDKIIDQNKNISLISTESCGASHTRNIGIKLSRGSIVIILDQDVLVDSNLLNVYNNDFQDESIDIVQGNIWGQISENKIASIHSKWRKSAFLDKARLNDGLLTTLITRNVALRKSFLEKYYLKDKYYFDEKMSSTGGEDREFGNRLYKFGAKIILDEDAIVYHKDPADLLNILKQKFRHARGDAKMGISEGPFDFINFKRVVINPLKNGVPLYFTLLIWIFHICGSEYEKLLMRLNRIFT